VPALSIAFDTIIVGALALPWVLLVIHLFFSDNEGRIGSLVKWVKEQQQPALAGVLLFALAYSLGSAVSRIAQDFLNDDDLYISVFGPLFRVGVTEASIRADVYCREQRLVPQTLVDSLVEPDQFSTKDLKCQYTGTWVVPQPYVFLNDAQSDMAAQVFHIQEGALLLKGTDANERLRQFHDQIMVLRGAAFDGWVAFSLCLFWGSAKFKPWLRWAVPLLYLVPGSIALYHHLRERAVSEPPYMEFTWLVLALAGWYVLWQRRRKKKRGVPATPGVEDGRGKFRFVYLALSAFLTLTAVLGWWSTERLYDQQVILPIKPCPGIQSKAAKTAGLRFRSYFFRPNRRSR